MPFWPVTIALLPIATPFVPILILWSASAAKLNGIPKESKIAVVNAVLRAICADKCALPLLFANSETTIQQPLTLEYTTLYILFIILAPIHTICKTYPLRNKFKSRAHLEP